MSKLKTAFRILATIMPFSKLRIFLFRLGGTKIGNNVKIEKRVKISKHVKIGSNVTIGENTILKTNTIIKDNVKIERDCSIYHTKIGNGTIIHKGSILFGGNEILVIGENCSIGYYSILDGSGGLKIGNNVQLASPSVGIWSHSSIPCSFQGVRIGTEKYEEMKMEERVKIKDNAWLGGKVTVYPGCRIGHHSIVLPNSVVNRDVNSYSMVGGVPIKTIKNLNEDDFK